jgi:hypothetical protein
MVQPIHAYAWRAATIVIFCWVAIAAPKSVGAQQAKNQTLNEMCARLCGGTWRATLRRADGSALNVSFVYQFDELGTVLQGRGYFTPSSGTAWIDRHYYMADRTSGQVQYVGVSPAAGMTMGQVRMEKTGFTAIVSAVSQPMKLARIVNEFPDKATHNIIVFQSDDGFRTPAPAIILRRSATGN